MQPEALDDEHYPQLNILSNLEKSYNYFHL
jgi:hypothetical protein